MLEIKSEFELELEKAWAEDVHGHEGFKNQMVLDALRYHMPYEWYVGYVENCIHQDHVKDFTITPDEYEISRQVLSDIAKFNEIDRAAGRSL